ncbi:hypothetical protein Leryth_000697 [Lithospermum erythrorhizon]|uniref:NAC domain-containing protein n=1 Tax=Lithospermum erythrorhizon TaxID=34254 RepID=A0AAV3PX16_LITER|nr:hypothetical protein Leryth_000697 [Lithospermum erythrorhizon]
MLAIEEILCELSGDDDRNGQRRGLPPGFRFHPTDEELLSFYLATKVLHGSFYSGVEIAEVDLNKCEPWELPEGAKLGKREWYLFSLRDRKYPSGLRTNRATGAGYWKATGKDKEIYSSANGGLLGMKKTLVFYKGRAPKGEKTKWVMHEYRLDGHFSYRRTSKEEWVICRIYHKIEEKKKSLIQGHGCNIMRTHNPTLLPPLLETSPTTLLESQSHNPMECLESSFPKSPFPFQHNQENDDFKSLISPCNKITHQQPLTMPNNNANNSNIYDSLLFQPSLSAITTSNIASSSTSLNFKHPFTYSHQDGSLKELANAIAKQCKTESNYLQSPCQSSNNFQNQLGFSRDDQMQMWMEDALPIKVTGGSWPFSL